VELKTHVLIGHPVRVILDLVRELNADLLVVRARRLVYLCRHPWPAPMR
jgi:nucleotide-binding universal stress UspA family protein